MAGAVASVGVSTDGRRSGAGAVILARLVELVHRCLQKDREARPQDARALGKLLAAVDTDGWDAERARRWWESHPHVLRYGHGATEPTGVTAVDGRG